jgi:hypothetical protein
MVCIKWSPAFLFSVLVHMWEKLIQMSHPWWSSYNKQTYKCSSLRPTIITCRATETRVDLGLDMSAPVAEVHMWYMRHAGWGMEVGAKRGREGGRESVSAWRAQGVRWGREFKQIKGCHVMTKQSHVGRCTG